jgi:hypothetical protein
MHIVLRHMELSLRARRCRIQNRRRIGRRIDRHQLTVRAPILVLAGWRTDVATAVHELDSAVLSIDRIFRILLVLLMAF